MAAMEKDGQIVPKIKISEKIKKRLLIQAIRRSIV